MSRISRGCGGAEEALVCSLRLGCLALLLVVFPLRVKAATESCVLSVREVGVGLLL